MDERTEKESPPAVKGGPGTTGTPEGPRPGAAGVPDETARTLAAVDIGSNALRMKVVRLDEAGALQPLDDVRLAIRGGGKVFRTRTVKRRIEARLRDALETTLSLAAEHGAEVRVAATSALREAENGPEVAARLEERLGVTIEIVSGRREAELIGRGAFRGNPSGRIGLALDVGGGSTELIVARGEQLVCLESFPLGALQLTERFGSEEAIDRTTLEAMRAEAHGALAELPALEALWEAPDAKGPDAFVTPEAQAALQHATVTSGTLRALVSFSSGGAGRVATAEQLRHAVVALVGMSPRERRRRFSKSRAQTLVAGAVIVEALLDRLPIATMKAGESGLRDGLLAELADGFAAGSRRV